MGKHAKKGGFGESLMLSKVDKIGKLAELYQLMKVDENAVKNGILSGKIKISNIEESVNSETTMLDQIKNVDGAKKHFYEEGKEEQKIHKPGMKELLNGFKDTIGIGMIFKGIEQLKKNKVGASHSFPPPTNINIAKLMKAYYSNLKKDGTENAEEMVPNVIKGHDVQELTKRASEALVRMIMRSEKGNPGRPESKVLSDKPSNATSEPNSKVNAEGKDGFIESFFQNAPAETALEPGQLKEASRLAGGTGGGGFMQSNEVGGEDASIRNPLTDLAPPNIVNHLKWDPNKSSTAKDKDGKEVKGEFVKKDGSGPIIASSENVVHTTKGQIKSSEKKQITMDDFKNKGVSVLDIIVAEMENTTLGGKRKTKKAKKSRKSRKARKSKKSRKGGKC